MFVKNPEVPAAVLPGAFYVPSSHLANMERLREQLVAGEHPSLANGYEFVCALPPLCDRDGLITASAYTSCFSKRQIPYAPPGSILFAHDIGHMPSFQSMFRVPKFADMVQIAASKALSSPKSCEEFAASMDQFGDALRSLSMRMYDGMFEKADVALSGLVHLFSEDIEPPVDTTALHNEMWQRLAIADYASA